MRRTLFIWPSIEVALKALDAAQSEMTGTRHELAQAEARADALEEEVTTLDSEVEVLRAGSETDIKAATAAAEARMASQLADAEQARAALLADATKTEARLSAEIEKVSTALAAAEDARYAAEESSDLKEKENAAENEQKKALLEEREALAQQTAKLVNDLAATIASAGQAEAEVRRELDDAEWRSTLDPATAKKLAEVKELNRKISDMKTTLEATVGDMRGVEEELRRRLEVAESAALKAGWCRLTVTKPVLKAPVFLARN